ncbi:MAG: hypothetical protein K2M75_06685 [Clostridia bacterium]|nr:hypothetical protein [Clostridia bacterium]
MAKDNRSTGRGAAPNRAGRPTGSYNSYGTSGYGTGAGYGYGRSPYGANAQPTNAKTAVNSNVPATVNKKAEKDEAPEKGLKGKQKKLAKRAKKFDETDLRCYPMTIRGWIGTFILLAIPLVNVICGICWFFGVGNKSRSSWVRSYVVIVMLVVLLFVIIVGAGFGVLNSKAKNVAVEFDGVSYGKLGDYGVKGTLYYVTCVFVDTFGEQLVKQIMGQAGGNGSGSGETGSGEEGGEVSSADGVKMVKAMLATKILGINLEGEQGSTGGTGGISSGEAA